MLKRFTRLLAAAVFTLGLAGVLTVSHPLTAAAACIPDGNTNAAVVFAGGPHVFSYNPCNGYLVHRWWNGRSWNEETLDGGAGGTTVCTVTGCDPSENIGGSNVAVVYRGQLHVFTRNTSTKTLRHDWYDGTWHFEQLDGTGSAEGSTSLDDLGTDTVAAVYSAQLQVFSLDFTNFSLRHDWWDGTAWHFETLDGAGSSGTGGRTAHEVAFYNSVDVYSNQLHAFTYDATDHSLRHDWYDGVWHFEVLDGSSSPYPGAATGHDEGRNNSAIGYNGQLHVFYYDGSDRTLHHAWWNGSSWGFQCLDGDPGDNGACVNDTSALASDGLDDEGDTLGTDTAPLVFNGQLQVFYTEGFDENLLHSWWNGTKWQSQPLAGNDPGSACCGTDSIGEGNAALVFGSQPQVWSDDETSPPSLFHGWWNGATWQSEKLS